MDDIDLNMEIDDCDEYEWVEDVNEADAKIVVKLRTLVRKIRKSVLMRQKLNKLCTVFSVKYLVPILNVITRWNSTYDMILRAEHLRTPLKALCTNEKSLISLRITDRECHSTIHAYLPTLDWLIVSLQSIVRGPASLVHAAKAGLQKLQKYEEIIYSSNIPFIATFLNPALKLNYFKEHKYPNSKVREVKNMISDYFSENYDSESESQDAESVDREDEDDELYMHMYKRAKYPPKFKNI